MSLLTTQQITLDLTVPRVQNVRCVQDDQNTRLVRIVVTNNGEPFLLNPETMIISYKVCKPDSRYVWNKTGITINDDGTVTVDLSEQALAITGIAKSALKIQEGEEKISTLPFNIIVEKAVVGNDELISESESDVIDEMENHLIDYNNPHKTDAAQVGLGNVPNVATNDQTPTYTEADKLTALTSGEKLSTAFGKLAKAVTELITHLSDKFIHITDEERTSWNAASDQTHTHSNQNVLDSISSASISNWNDKYTKNEVDNKFSTLETNIDWKESVNTYDDIATAYPSPQDGWTVNVKDTDYTYRYNGLEWVAISANAIPKATADIDGLMSKEDKTTLDNLSGGSVTGVKGAAETNYRQGNINLTPENIGALPMDGMAISAKKSEQDGNGNVISNTYFTKTEGDALKKSVSDGKTTVAKVITEQGIVTAADASFATIAQNIQAAGTSRYNAGYSAGNIADYQAGANDSKKGTATANQVLSGYTFTNTTGINLAGAMANQGAKAATLNCGESYTIPAGYHNGSGKITANTLTFQTSATATAPQLLSGYTAWANGNKITGTMINRGNLNWNPTTAGSKTIAAGYYSGGTISNSAAISNELQLQLQSITAEWAQKTQKSNTITARVVRGNLGGTDINVGVTIPLSQFKKLYTGISFTTSIACEIYSGTSSSGTKLKTTTAGTAYTRSLSDYSNLYVQSPAYNTNGTVKFFFYN